MSKLIAPSILSADFSKLGSEVEMLNSSEADWIHVDVMDGVFVPNISFGFPVIEKIKEYASKPLDVHLMIINPDQYFEKFKSAGADILTIHYEAETHLHRAVSAIKELGMKAGVALNPHTPAALLEDIIQYLDLVLIMSVNPGFGGQKFISNTYNKVSRLKKLINDSGSKALIEVDGGVNLTNSTKLYKAGVDILVAGNSVFSSVSPKQTIKEIKSARW